MMNTYCFFQRIATSLALVCAASVQANPAAGSNPTPEQVAEARAAVAQRNGPANAKRAPSPYDNQICMASAVEARASPFWTWKGFWQTGYDTVELGKTYKLPNGNYTNTPFCRCWKDHRAWGDNWRVAFALPSDPVGLKGANSEEFSMGENSRSNSTLVMRDAKGAIRLQSGDCSAIRPGP